MLCAVADIGNGPSLRASRVGTLTIAMCCHSVSQEELTMRTSFAIAMAASLLAGQAFAQYTSPANPPADLQAPKAEKAARCAVHSLRTPARIRDLLLPKGRRIRPFARKRETMRRVRSQAQTASRKVKRSRASNRADTRTSRNSRRTTRGSGAARRNRTDATSMSRWTSRATCSPIRPNRTHQSMEGHSYDSHTFTAL